MVQPFRVETAPASRRPDPAAALKTRSPACAAVTVQEPAPVMWTVLPATVHGPLAEKDTGRPESAVAVTVKSASPGAFGARASKVMVWSAGPDKKVDPKSKANVGANKDNILSWKP